MRALAAALVLSLLTGGPLPDPVRETPGSSIFAATQGAAQQVDQQRSTLVAILHKEGLLRFLGHEHGILATEWSAHLSYRPDDVEATAIAVTVQVARLEIDTAAARRAAGVDPDGPDEQERAGIRERMLGADQLDVGTYPTIAFKSTRVRRNGDSELRVEGELTLHGITRAVAFPVKLEPLESGLKATGELELELRDFDIEPVSIGGVVKVANGFEIRFEIAASGPEMMADEDPAPPATTSLPSPSS